MSQTVEDRLDDAIQRLTHWIGQYGDSKPKPFVEDVTVVVTTAKEYRRLRLYERAMQSMAAQVICPKMTAEEMAKMQLGEK